MLTYVRHNLDTKTITIFCQGDKAKNYKANRYYDRQWSLCIKQAQCDAKELFEIFYHKYLTNTTIVIKT